MIKTYRLEQCRIIAAQYSILNTVLMALQQIKLLKLSHSYAINQLCCGAQEHLVNALNMRRYFK